MRAGRTDQSIAVNVAAGLLALGPTLRAQRIAVVTCCCGWAHMLKSLANQMSYRLG